MAVFDWCLVGYGVIAVASIIAAVVNEVAKARRFNQSMEGK
ncbi:hypothetical protein [Streptomyces sp. NPDC004682]